MTRLLRSEVVRALMKPMVPMAMAISTKEAIASVNSRPGLTSKRLMENLIRYGYLSKVGDSYVIPDPFVVWAIMNTYK